MQQSCEADIVDTGRVQMLFEELASLDSPYRLTQPALELAVRLNQRLGIHKSTSPLEVVGHCVNIVHEAVEDRSRITEGGMETPFLTRLTATERVALLTIAPVVFAEIAFSEEFADRIRVIIREAQARMAYWTRTDIVSASQI